MRIQGSVIIFFFLFYSSVSFAQEVDLFSEDDEEKPEMITKSIFKTTRIINGQSIENTGKGVLDLKILHRFGPLNQGAYELFGLDQATMRIGLDYGVLDRLQVGIGRSTFQKQFDGYAKYRILRQQTGKRNIPLSVSYAATLIYKTLKSSSSFPQNESDRFTYAHQLLIAKKFNDYFSLQLTPTLFHYNVVPSSALPNDFFSLGVGFRQRLTKRVNLTGEYFYRFDKLPGYQNALSLGFDIETGGHVFQLHFTNSTGMTERTFINETTGSWMDGDVRFGFNIARVFTISKPKELRK
jgi:hypothetical protein